MDSAGIAERTWPPATVPANGRAPEPNPAADPTMTHAVREERAAQRRAAPEAWRRDLEALYHYDAEYPYDPGHEYEPYWTTDPNYGIEEGIHHCRFDADGVEVMADLRARDIQRNAGYTIFDKMGDCVELETGIHYVAPNGVVRRVFPDLMVLPEVGMLGTATGPERALRIDQGAPPPVLVLEILSYGGTQRDLDKKLRLYERLGVREYLVYDLGGKRRRGAPRELLLYRLEDGAYRRIDPEPQESASDPEVHWSEVFGTHVRMMPDPQEKITKLPETTGPPPRFQWWDARQDRWRDRQTDTEVEREAERDRIVRERDQAVQERTDFAIAMMRSLLSRELGAANLDRVEEAWRRASPHGCSRPHPESAAGTERVAVSFAAGVVGWSIGVADGGNDSAEPPIGGTSATRPGSASAVAGTYSHRCQLWMHPVAPMSKRKAEIPSKGQAAGTESSPAATWIMVIQMCSWQVEFAVKGQDADRSNRPAA